MKEYEAAQTPALQLTVTIGTSLRLMLLSVSSVSYEVAVKLDA